MSEGKKFDNGKLDWSLLDMALLEPLIPVFALGEERYGYLNWKKDFGPEYQRRFEAALKRHLKECQYDPLAVNEKDGGVFHLAQVAWNCLVLLHHAQHGRPLSPIEALRGMKAEAENRRRGGITGTVDTSTPTGEGKAAVSADNDVLTLVLRHAPHGHDCRPEEGKPCTCWKAEALKKLRDT